jgi:hypothetical protein
MRPYVVAFFFFTGPCFAAGDPAPEHSCFTAAETREKIFKLGLVEPFYVMKNATARLQAEVIGLRLCSRREELVYELSLLRHDGRIIHVLADAKTGQLASAKPEH